MYDWLFKVVLTRVDAERAHRAALNALRAIMTVPGMARLGRRCLGPSETLRVRAFGLDFPSPVGLAAGFDKDGLGVDALAALGFGFVEVGTVTAHSQPGNPRPRVLRLVPDRALVNRMGFNNEGAELVARRLARRAGRRRSGVVVGVNVGKSRAVPDSAAVDDYVTSTRLVAPYADYLVVNVSSPNTPGLRQLQEVERLKPLLHAIRTAADDAAGGRHVPLLVKIAPDLADADLLAVADLVLDLGLDGIVATNTTVERNNLRSSPADVEATGSGGLSGAPLRERSLEVLRLLRDRVGDRVVVVSAGGVETPDDAWERLRVGATLVQAYTGLVYGGPMWPARMNRGLARRLEGKHDAEFVR